MKLAERERVVAVVPQSCQGPGWGNKLFWVFVEGPNGIRREALQLGDLLQQTGKRNVREERSAHLVHLFSVGEVVCRELICSAADLMGEH